MTTTRTNIVPKPKGIINLKAGANIVGRVPEKRYIVLHDTESRDVEGTADVRSIDRYLDESTPYGVQAIVDGEGHIGQAAPWLSIVQHATGANTYGIGIEQIGFARFTTRRWLWDRWSRYPARRKQRKQLMRVAHLIAWLSQEYGIPLVHSTSHGIALHSDFPAGGHSDPGAGYPLGYVLKHARRIKRGGKVPPAPRNH